MVSDEKEITSIEKPHTLSIDEAMESLRTSAEGLDREEAAHRLQQVGPNKLPDPPREGPLKRFLKHFHNVLIYILIGAAVVTATLGHWIDTWVILAVVIINALIGFIQEGRAEQALEGIRKMLSLHAQARREGQWVDVEAEELVPGDLVRLRAGDRVPADVRLIDASNLQVEESALTGESVPTEKDTKPCDPDAGIGDRHGMAYSGTMVTAGQATAVVTATGVATEIGRINKMIAEVQKVETPLTRQMNRFGQILSIVILGLAALMWVLGWLMHDYTAGELFLASIGFAVAAIPEGLPAVLTITLALGVQRMARRNAITRRLNAVETLGSVTVICSDKTGTLTRNEMTAREAVTRAGTYRISGIGYRPEGTITRDGEEVALHQQADLKALVEVLAVCNDAEVSEDEGDWKVAGSPTEGALRTLALKAGFDSGEYKRLAMIPFESESKLMATLNRVPEGGVRILLKGAPDRLLDRCGSDRGEDGSAKPLDRDYWEDRIKALSSEGLRVLAAAARDVDSGKDDLQPEDIEREMVFLGLVGVLDPPRQQAIEAIKTCRQAGIRVKMITGDHVGTAKAIGREMGIGDGEHAVTGADLEAASDEELRQLARDNDIFARTSPQHKLRLVMALQADSEVVAMTGDGVNDAPALKRADVGVAMGIKGTEATKEAAEIVLADDNFTSIEQAIEEGRTIYDNLRKAILFIIPTNGAEALVIVVAVLLGMTLPLTPVQILWVNMVTAVTLALALAFEPSEPGLMRRPPRRPGTSIIDRVFVWRIAFVSTLIGGATIAVFMIATERGMSLELARTIAVNTLVCGQVFYLFNSRHLRESSLAWDRWFANRAVWPAVGILVAWQILFVYAPPMNRWFGSEAMAWQLWLFPLGVGAAVFLIVEGEKAVVRRVTQSVPRRAGHRAEQ